MAATRRPNNTTTPARPIGTKLGPSSGPNRPILELFLKKSCQPYVEGDHGTAFFEWCADPSEKEFDIDCGISGSAACPSKVQFVRANAKLAAPILAEIKDKWYKEDDFIGIHFEQRCNWGGGQAKPQKAIYTDSFESKDARTYYTNECYRTAYGDPAMPLWAILLIIVAMLAAVGIAFTIFYYVWLRRRIKGQDGTTASAISSISALSTKTVAGSGRLRSGDIKRTQKTKNKRRLLAVKS